MRPWVEILHCTRTGWLVLGGILLALLCVSMPATGGDGPGEKEADVVVSFEVQLSSGEILRFSSQVGRPAILRDGVSDYLLGFVPRMNERAGSEVSFDILHLKEEKASAILGRRLPVGDLLLRSERTHDRSSVSLGDWVTLSENSAEALRLDAISLRARDDAAVDTKPREAYTNGTLFLLEDLCCAICDSGIGGCGASVTTSCGATCGAV